MDRENIFTMNGKRYASLMRYQVVPIFQQCACLDRIIFMLSKSYETAQEAICKSSTYQQQQLVQQLGLKVHWTLILVTSVSWVILEAVYFSLIGNLTELKAWIMQQIHTVHTWDNQSFVEHVVIRFKFVVDNNG